MEKSVKWLEVAAGPDLAADNGNNQERISTCADGNAVVSNFPAKPLNLVTIWGAAKTGKSFFLNALAQTDGLFHVSGAMEPCTTGVDLSRTVTPLYSIKKNTTASSALGSSSSSEPPFVGFVDVEGQGDKHYSYDMLLTTPLLLLSKASKPSVKIGVT